MRFFVFFAFAFFLTFSAEASEKVILHTKTGPKKVFVEVASSKEARRVGLMFRQYMPADNGMLFLFGKNQNIVMWMKNTYLPLDMVFINEDGEIRCILKNREPLSLVHQSCGEKTSSVLEVNAGKTDEWGVSVGDIVEYKAFKK